MIANRLSENPNFNILLLEAGGTETFYHQIPLISGFLPLTDSNWQYKSVPQKRACFGMNNNECAQPRGKVLGGISGNKHDFDMCADFGNPGWSYKVVPYFMKSEGANSPDLANSSYHNMNGPLPVEYPSYRTETVHHWVAAAKQAGYPTVDYNGESQLGVSYVQSTTQDGRRASASKAFIEPVKSRPNLRIITNAQVTRVFIDNSTLEAYGVEYNLNNKMYTVNCTNEVIIAAGTFSSPQILMLSGIGPLDNLNRIGIPVLKELPVGKIMYDHICHAGLTFITNTSGNAIHFRDLSPIDVARYFLHSPSKLNIIGGFEALAFFKINKNKKPYKLPDTEHIFISGSFATDLGYGLSPGANFKRSLYNSAYRPIERLSTEHFTVFSMLFHPKSIGSLWLESNDSEIPPMIHPNYFIIIHFYYLYIFI